MVIGAASVPTSPSSGERLLAVLESAEALPSVGRLRPRRAVLHGTARTRRALPAARPVPSPRLRPAAAVVPPRPATPLPVMWRPLLASTPAPAAAPVPRTRPGLVRRLALWGAGPDGAHLAWNRPAPAAPAPYAPAPAPGAPAPAATAPAAVPSPARRGPAARLRRGIRRLALWGAGPTGAHLAWNVPPQPRVWSARLPAVPPRSPAVVRLAELPSTPLIRPAASSPAAALLPAPRPGAAGVHLRTPVRPPRASQPRASEPTGWPAVRPEPCPALPAPSGWPSRAVPAPRAGVRSPGRARTRGDPTACRVRGPTP